MMRFLSNLLAAPALVLALLGLCLGASMASAQVPHDMNYQGRLTDSVGAPLAGPVDLELRIFDVLSGGVALFAENHTAVPLDDDGGFNLLLGSGAATTGTFDASLFAGVNRYLEVVIEGDVLSPRLPFSSVPYAMVAEEAAVVQGAPTLITDVQTLQTQVGSPTPGDPSVVDRLTSQGVTIGTNTVAATTAQASADSASTTAAAAQSTATATDAALTALQATLPGFQDLSGQDFSGQDLSGQDFSYSNLTGAILVGTNLANANLYRSDLSGADLTGADIRGANLSESNLTNANLDGTKVGPGNGSVTTMNGATVGGNFLVLQLDSVGCGAVPGDCLVADGAFFRWGQLGSGVHAVGASFLELECGENSDYSDSTVVEYMKSSATCIADGLNADNVSGIGEIAGSHRNSSFKNAEFAAFGSKVSGDLSGSNLSGANLIIQGGILSGSNLTGAVLSSYLNTGGSLVGANLTNLVTLCPISANPGTPCHANQGLVISCMRGFNLTSADLSGVDLSVYSSTTPTLGAGTATCLPSFLAGADLSSAILGNFSAQRGADLSAIPLQGVKLPSNLAFTVLAGSDLSGMDLTNADLRSASLESADLTGTNLTGAKLANANLIGATLTGTILSGADLAGADLSGATLTNAIVTGADLTGADLAGASLAGTDFSSSTLDDATLTSILNSNPPEATAFVGASLLETSLGGNFTGADFRNANLAGADLSAQVDANSTPASLVGANFTGASLANALGLAQADTEQIDFTGANLEGIDLTTLAPNIICPDGTTASTNPSSNCVGHVIVDAIAAVYSTLQPQVSANLASISDNETDITGNDMDIASNASAISSEATRAAAAEGVNAAAVSAEQARATNAEGVNAAAVSAEQTRATNAEGVNAAAVSAEQARATNAEAVLADDLTDEATARTAADAAHDSAISAETTRAITAEDSNALEINDLISELALDVVQVGDPRLSFAGTWTSQSDSWGANRFSSVSRYSSCEGDADCSSHTITLALDNNAWRTVLVSTLDWHRNHYFDVFISFDGGANYTFHNRIETYRPSYTDPYVSSIRTLVSNLPQGQDVRVRVQATRGRIHFEGFALSHAVLPEDVQNRIAVRSEDGTISGNYVLEGDITVGTAATGSLKIARDIDVTTTGGSGSLSIGDPAAANIGIDTNEIMARDGSSSSVLHLNREGGDVSIGAAPAGAPSNLDVSGNVDVGGSVLAGWERVSAAGSTSVASTCSFGGSTFSCRRGTATASCSAGKVVLGGGCSCETQAFSSGYNQTCRGYPADNSSFVCHSYSPSSGVSFTAYAICARMGD